jgi:hypothetical protein
MPAQFLAHTAFLVIATLLTYLWTVSPILSPFTLQLVAIFVLLYFATTWLFRHHRTSSRSLITVDLAILTITILLLVAQTGGLGSPIFFTIYFLLFAVALLFETPATLVMTGVLVVFLTLLPSSNLTSLAHLAELVAMVMITPLAIFTGHEHELALEAQKTKKKLLKTVSRDETDVLLFLSLNLKRTLTSAIDTLSLTIPQEKVTAVRQNLQVLYTDLKALYKSSTELEQLVDKETDSLK